jgi:hypothetical protein
MNGGLVLPVHARKNWRPLVFLLEFSITKPPFLLNTFEESCHKYLDLVKSGLLKLS